MTQSTPPPAHPERPRRRLWLRVLLFASLAMNLAVIGIVGGAVLGLARNDERPARMSRELGLGPYLYALDSAERAALYQEARARRSELRAGRAAWQQAFAETLEVLRADSFDAPRFRELVAEQAALALDGRRIGQEILVEELSEMDPEARRAFADRLEQGLRMGHPPHDHGNRQPPL